MLVMHKAKNLRQAVASLLNNPKFIFALPTLSSELAR